MTSEQVTTVIEIGDVTLPGAPDDGLVVSRGTSVAMEVACKPSGAAGLLNSLFYLRQMTGGGEYTDWRHVASADTGVSACCTPATGGIYQVKAFVRIGMGYSDARYYRWDADECRDIGIMRKGDLKAFGVCDEEWQKTLRNHARGFIGSVAYREDIDVEAQYGFSEIPAGPPKCNIFIAHMIARAELECPVQYRGRYFISSYPPVANDWCSVDIAIAGWLVLPNNSPPQPGFVAAIYGVEMGHCGILDFDGMAISAQDPYVTRRSSRLLRNGRYRRYYNP